MGLTERVATRYVEKTAMAVLLRNVAQHDWGFFSREDPRMHLQTADLEALQGPKKVKFWLENRGKRTFELATGKLSGPDTKALERKVTAARGRLETLWVHLMLQKNWLVATLRGSIVTLTAYPGQHNAFDRKIDLKQVFPGAYIASRPGNWAESPPSIDFDLTNGALAVGAEKDLDNRSHVVVAEHLFVD